MLAVTLQGLVFNFLRDRNGTRTRITMAFPLSDAIYLPFVPKRAHCWIILRQIFVSPYALELA